MSRFIKLTEAPTGRPVFVMAAEVTAVKTLDIKDYIPRSMSGEVIANAPPIVEMGPRTLLEVAYERYTVRESAEYVMHLLACALGEEMYEGQEIKV